MFLLDDSHNFPPIELASKEGVLAIGGDLHPERVIKAYLSGIFPWYEAGEPIVWYSPDPRMVLFPEEVKISKSMRKILRNEDFKVTFNQNFEQVIHLCKNVKRKDQEGTWITDELEKTMITLHRQGIARSVEVWQNNRLVGGLYGLDFGTIFCGESMFSLVSNASKVAFINLAKDLAAKKYPIIDCQLYNEHLASLGAIEIPRSVFKQYLPK
jgi:leucyl/phenylalanyl-tRNA--protein transferase